MCGILNNDNGVGCQKKENSEIKKSQSHKHAQMSKMDVRVNAL